MQAKNIDADNIKEDNMDAEQIRDLRNRLQSAKSTRMFMVSVRRCKETVQSSEPV